MEGRRSEAALNGRRALSRREFLLALGGAAAAAALGPACRMASQIGPSGPTPFLPATPTPGAASPSATPSILPASATPESLIGRVALIRTGHRAEGVRRAMDLLGINPVEGKSV